MANTPISGLNPGGPVDDTDLFPDVQTVGVGPVKVTAAQIKTYTSDNPVLVNPNIGDATGTSLSLNTSGSYSTKIESSGSATQSWTFVLPPDDGTNGYILTTNGSGISSWTNPTALGIDIDVNSTAITGGASGRIVYDNSGTFGEVSAITTNGSDTLTIGAQQTIQGNVVLANTAAGAFPVSIKSSNSTSAAWSLTLPTNAGTNKYALTTDGSGVSSWSQIDLSAAVTGTLPVNHGGTGQTSLAAHGVVIGNSTSGVNVTATGSAGQVFQSGGASADPVWSTATFPATATSTGTILRADGTNWVATTATYPTTTSINEILYSNANNQVTGLTTGNGGVLNTNSSGVPSITANPTFGVQQTTQGSLVLANTAAGAFSTTIKSSNSASEAWTLTLPISKGTNGYILTTDGTGVSAWTNPTALGIDIDVNSTAITSGTSGRLVYDNAGTFGEISAVTTNGSDTLTIGVQQTTQGKIVLDNTAAGAFQTTIQSSNSASAAWTLTLPTTGGTNNYVLTTNGSGVSSWSQVSLTAGVTGVLPAANGGTGQSTNTLHGVLIGNAGNAINATTAGSSGQVLQSGGASSDPTWTTATFPSTATATGAILRADGTNWAATTATYPTTTTAGTILVSSSANAVTSSSSPTLGVQQTTQGSLILANTAAGAFSTTLKSSNSATEAWTLTLPVSKGTSGYILTTDGTGVSSWTNPTSLGIDIDVNSTAITGGTSGRIVYDNAGTFGEITAITTNGSGTLTIGTQQTTQGSLVLGNTAAGAFATTVQSSNSASSAWTLTLPTTAGTNNYVLTTNGSGTSSWSQVSLTAGVTGVLPAANGGTGQSTNTIHGVLIGNAANAINSTSAGSAGQLLTSGGASADPVWTTATFPSTATSTGTILRADGTNWSATTATYPTTTSAGTILVSATANAVTGTATPTLGVQQTTQGQLILANTSAGAFSTTLQSSNSASAAWTLTLPTTAGTNNYVLTTNGSGVSSWSQVSLTAGVTGILPVANGGTGTSTAFTSGSIVFAGAAGVYSQDNSNLYYDSANIRIGLGVIPTVAFQMDKVGGDARMLLRGEINARLQIRRYTTDTNGPGYEFAKYRGTIASPTTVVTGDELGYIIFYGYDGSALIESASIRSSCEGTVSTSVMPGNIKFYTTLPGGSSATQAAIINSSGCIGVGTASPGGNSTNKVIDVYGSASSALTSSTVGHAASLSATTAGYCFLYTTTSSALYIGTNSTEAMRIDTNLNVVVSTAALATNATNGFLYIPTCAGTPTGVPSTYTGRSPIVYDTTNNKLYVYNGAWKSATFA